MTEVNIPQRVVLCIDDDDSSLAVRKMLLESAGFCVLTASTSRQGLELCASQHIDAAIVDFSMPQIDGGIVAARVKQIHPRVPVVMLTAYPGALEGVAEVVDCFMEKGGQPSALLNRLESLVRLRSHAHAELESKPVVFGNSFHQFLDCSDAVCELLGYSRPELLDKTAEDISYFDGDHTPIFQLYEREEAVSGELVLRHHRGRPVPVRFHSWAFPDGCLAAVLEPIQDWKDLYQAALLELNPLKRKERIEVALLAIHQRIRDLRENPSKEEWLTLNEALVGLGETQIK